jgi:hypothetical protein
MKVRCGADESMDWLPVDAVETLETRGSKLTGKQ